MRNSFIAAIIAAFFITGAHAQVPTAALIQIVKAEDARRYDSVLEALLRSPDAEVRKRAALAAGRIGNDAALGRLSEMLAKDTGKDVRSMAAFAIGEIESIKSADVILNALRAEGDPEVKGRLAEAAGKIAAANAKDDRSKDLGNAVLKMMENADIDPAAQTEMIRLGATALLRSRPVDADKAIVRFLDSRDADIRIAVINTLARLRAKNANEQLKKLAVSDPNSEVRANAIRALGSADDKASYQLFVTAINTEKDRSIRIAAIRSLANLKNKDAAPTLIAQGKKLLAAFNASKKINSVPAEQPELLEIAATLGRLLEKSKDRSAIAFLNDLRKADGYRSPESESALARIDADQYLIDKIPAEKLYSDPWALSAFAAGMQTIAETTDESFHPKAGMMLVTVIKGMDGGVTAAAQKKMMMAMPDLLRAMAAFKPDNLDEITRSMLDNSDVFIRAAAAEVLAERPPSKENIEALKAAFITALLTDKFYDDAQLGILDAIYKLDKNEVVGSASLALTAQDFLLRKKAMQMLSDPELQAKYPGLPLTLENARNKKRDEVGPYLSAFGTKLGQLLNSDIDYRRAVSRKNSMVKALVTTVKGSFTIDLLAEDAPLTVDNFIKLAKSGYFNGLTVHRVVPNFVMQDGDPRGDGNGGPGWSIRCEVNMVAYSRGSVGMALSGKDTGGSQWFATHNSQPHLDGGYTVFGKVNETDMKVVDQISRGDKIISIKIIEQIKPQSTQRSKSSKNQ